MGSIDNQNIVVIGGTSGIGLATAVNAASKGANVWAVSRSESKVKTCSDLHPHISFKPLDTHNVKGLKSLFESIEVIDHIVAAATGAERTMAPFMDQTDEQFREAFNKFWGYTNVARQGIPFLNETVGRKKRALKPRSPGRSRRVSRKTSRKGTYGNQALRE